MTQKVYEVLDRPEVGSVLFYPRRDVGAPKVTDGAHVVRIPVAPDVQLGGKIFVGAVDAPVILYFHGNGEIASDYNTIAPFYTDLGITLFVVDFRGYGQSDGMPSATALIEDAWECFSQLPKILGEHGVSFGKVFVMGRSLGSAAALEVADRAKDDIAGLIIESGFAYTFPLIERIGFLELADAYEHLDGFGNLDKIARVDVPTLIIHGERDWIIPVTDADALHEASTATQKTFVRIAGAGHNDLMLIGRQAYFDAIAAFCGVSAAETPPPDDLSSD